MISRWINVYVSIKNIFVSSPLYYAEECAHNEERIGYCWPIFDVDWYEFEFKYNASVLIDLCQLITIIQNNE